MALKIQETKISIEEVMRGYKNQAEFGVVAYNGLLDVRPPFQREYVYDNARRDGVIESIMKGRPINVMYWGTSDFDNMYELIDGQQRLISICMFCHGDFSITINGNRKYFSTLTPEQQRQIKNYQLTVYICSGSMEEKLEWFRVINIAGLQLNDQELRNSVYTGKWLLDAKRIFSKTDCAAYKLAKPYIKCDVTRQELLEKALTWVADRDCVTIEEYMARHCKDPNADDMWNYFRKVIGWVETTFKKYRKEMKGLPWGMYYNLYKDVDLGKSPTAIEDEIKALMLDDDITKKSGVYEYIFSRSERCLSLRRFSEAMKRTAYEKQNGVCPICKESYQFADMEGDHIVPWSRGGRTTAGNCQMLCRDCNRMKSDS